MLYVTGKVTNEQIVLISASIQKLCTLFLYPTHDRRHKKKKAPDLFDKIVLFLAVK